VSNKQIGNERIVVLQPIANYPCIIAFRIDNLNVGRCPDLSPSREGSGSETRAVCMYSVCLCDFISCDNYYDGIF